MPPSLVPLFTGSGPVKQPFTTSRQEFSEKVEANALTNSYGTLSGREGQYWSWPEPKFISPAGTVFGTQGRPLIWLHCAWPKPKHFHSLYHASLRAARDLELPTPMSKRSGLGQQQKCSLSTFFKKYCCQNEPKMLGPRPLRVNWGEGLLQVQKVRAARNAEMPRKHKSQCP